MSLWLRMLTERLGDITRNSGVQRVLQVLSGLYADLVGLVSAGAAKAAGWR